MEERMTTNSRGKNIPGLLYAFRSLLINNRFISIMENKNFKNLISMLEQKGNFEQTLARVNQEYLVKIYKITELKSDTITELFQVLQKKFYLHRKSSNQQFWYENQLRIFIWLLFAYLYLFQKNITDMNEEDWKYFSLIFNFKSIVFFQFQAFSLLKTQGRPPVWTQEETQLLQSIIKEKDHKNRWNSIARELFIRSNKLFFRNPKQCRERWMNHLDPSKIRTEWSQSQDLILLNCIKKRGKKWSIAVKQLDQTRTQHMVKNRYKSLISNQHKKYPDKKECQIENILIKKFSKNQGKQNKTIEKTIKVETNQEIVQKTQQNEANIKNQEINVKFTDFSTQNCFNSKDSNLKLQQQENSYHINLNECQGKQGELLINSPFFIPWKIDEVLHHKFDFMQNQKMQMNEEIYCDVDSQNQRQSFLRI